MRLSSLGEGEFFLGLGVSISFRFNSLSSWKIKGVSQDTILFTYNLNFSPKRGSTRVERGRLPFQSPSLVDPHASSEVLSHPSNTPKTLEVPTQGGRTKTHDTFMYHRRSFSSDGRGNLDNVLISITGSTR